MNRQVLLLSLLVLTILLAVSVDQVIGYSASEESYCNDFCEGETNPDDKAECVRVCLLTDEGL